MVKVTIAVHWLAALFAFMSAGQEIVQAWTRFIRQPHIRSHAVFLSDYDMLLIIETPRDQIYRLRCEGYRALFGVGASVDLLVMTPEYFRSRLTVVASLPATVRREGKLLYAA